MLHPSQLAVQYIWEAFSACYLDEKTSGIYREASKIVKASQHRISSFSGSKTKQFAENILDKIKSLERQVPGINLSKEKKYFLELC
jgi:hypothetical protein